jgi:phospholipase A1
MARWGSGNEGHFGPVTPYRPTYFMPLSYNFKPNQRVYQPIFGQHEPLSRVETKFQISFKVRLWSDMIVDDAYLWFGYTQRSYWQAYNRSLSNPFRETDFQPELIYAYRTDLNLFGLHARVLRLALDHQSNGQTDPLSRSWNRAIGGVLFGNNDFELQIRAWYRFPERRVNDDNPDIVHYVGRGDIRFSYKLGQETLTLRLSGNLLRGSDRGSVRLGWSFPIGGTLKGYVRYFYGYGDGLIDYNHRTSRISVGVVLFDWM